MKTFLAKLMLLAVAGGMSLSLPARAATCTTQAGNNNTSGDTFYGARACEQKYITQFWNHFDFDKDDWDDGFGWEAPCDLSRPLARTFNALWLLAYSAEDYAKKTSDFSGNALRWAYPYASNHIDELDGRCGSGNKNKGPRATTDWGLFANDSTELYWPFFYGENVVQRAGTVLHESRHGSGKGHDAGSSCPRGGSCDSSWGYKGANMYQVLYLWWFRVDGTRTTQAMRDFARTEAQSILNTGFQKNPGYVIP